MNDAMKGTLLTSPAMPAVNDLFMGVAKLVGFNIGGLLTSPESLLFDARAAVTDFLDEAIISCETYAQIPTNPAANFMLECWLSVLNMGQLSKHAQGMYFETKPTLWQIMGKLMRTDRSGAPVYEYELSLGLVELVGDNEVNSITQISTILIPINQYRMVRP